jgi:Tfp pilus assembly protein PilE
MIELLLVICILGLLASTAGVMFQNYVLRSRTPEAVLGVSKMAQGEISYYAINSAFVEAGPTPALPGQQPQTVDFAEDDPNWQLIDFSFSNPIRYSYQAITISSGFTRAVGEEGDDSEMIVDCMAFGDLDGDGEISTFRRSITALGTQNPLMTSIFTFDELE